MDEDHSAASVIPRRTVSWMVRLAIATVFIILILRSIDVGELTRTVASPEWIPLGGMVITALVFMALGAVKVWVLLGALAPVKLTRVLRYSIVAASLGTFTPAAVGDFSLVGFLRREGVPVHQGLSTMLVDRAITFATYGLVFLPLTLLLVIHDFQWLWVPAAAAVGIATFLGLNVYMPFRRWLRDRVVLRYAPRFEEFFRTFSDLLRRHPLRLAANVGVTLLRAIVSGAVIYCALLAAGTRADLLPVTIITNSLSLLIYLPISVSGIGVYEGGAVAAFSYLGLSNERVLAAFVFQRLYMIGSSLVFLALSRVLLPPSGASHSPPATELR